MRTSDELLREVYRRARVLRIRRLRRKKWLLGLGCLALTFLLAFLLNGQSSMRVAAHAETYGSLVFEGRGSEYVMIAVLFFLLGIPAGLGIDWLFRRRRQWRMDRYKEKWMGEETTQASTEG